MGITGCVLGGGGEREGRKDFGFELDE